MRHLDRKQHWSNQSGVNDIKKEKKKVMVSNGLGSYVLFFFFPALGVLRFVT